MAGICGSSLTEELHENWTFDLGQLCLRSEQPGGKRLWEEVPDGARRVSVGTRALASGKPNVYFLYFFLLFLTFLQKSRKSNSLYFFFTCQVREESRLVKYT